MGWTKLNNGDHYNPYGRKVIKNPYTLIKYDYAQTQAWNFQVELGFMRRIGAASMLYGGIACREQAVKNFKEKTKRNRSYFSIRP